MAKIKKAVRAGRRPPPKTSREIPLLPIAVAAVLVAAGVGLVVWAAVSAAGPTRANVRCEAAEQLANHYHAHLEILNEGNSVRVPAQLGIGSSCLYWLHTHDDTGIIHIEAPANQRDRTFTLGDFFDVWGQPLDSTHVATITLRPDQHLVVYVDGKAYEGSPRSIPLLAHTLVVLEITPPKVDPPPGYSFPSGY